MSEPQIRVGKNPDRHLSATGHKPTSMPPPPRLLSNSIRERRPVRGWIGGLIRVCWRGRVTCRPHPHPHLHPDSDSDPDRCGGIRGHEEAHQLTTTNGLRPQHGGDTSIQLGRPEDGALGKRPCLVYFPPLFACPESCGMEANHMRMNPHACSTGTIRHTRRRWCMASAG